MKTIDHWNVYVKGKKVGTAKTEGRWWLIQKLKLEGKIPKDIHATEIRFEAVITEDV